MNAPISKMLLRMTAINLTLYRLYGSLATRADFCKCVLPISNGSLLWHFMYSSSYSLAMLS